MMDYLQGTMGTGNIKDIWYGQIAACNAVHDLPEELRALVIQFLPRFLSQFPQDKDNEALPFAL